MFAGLKGKGGDKGLKGMKGVYIRQCKLLR